MKRIDELFHVHRARSRLFSEYEPGRVAYVTNSADTNGVLGFVEPLDGDRVFDFTGIVVNSFSRTVDSCGARVQTPPFIACSRSGNGLLVLEPKSEMTIGTLAYLAAYINHAHGWRFTWYRQATKDRLIGLPIPESSKQIAFPVKRLLPVRNELRRPTIKMRFKAMPLDSLFSLNPGDHHSEADLERGSIPLVSCGDENNGVISYVDVPGDTIHQNCLTIAFNGRPLTTKYHPYSLTAKDDVAVAEPKKPLRLTSLLFVQMMLNRERWRYSYYRKCFVDKLRRFEIQLPYSNGNLDEDAMAASITCHPYWPYMASHMDVQPGASPDAFVQPS